MGSGCRTSRAPDMGVDIGSWIKWSPPLVGTSFLPASAFVKVGDTVKGPGKAWDQRPEAGMNEIEST